jgi:hypothetical protein
MNFQILCKWVVKRLLDNQFTIKETNDISQNNRDKAEPSEHQNLTSAPLNIKRTRLIPLPLN